MNQQPQNGQRPRRPDPRREAARRAYIAKRRKEVRRNRILLGSVAVILLALFITLLVFIVRILISAVRGEDFPDSGTKGSGKTPAEMDTLSGNMNPLGTDILPETTPAVTEEPEPVYDLNFKADLTDYEKYMDPKEDRDAYLILVNASHPLSADDVPEDLTDLSATRKDGRDTQRMRHTAAKALEALFIEAQAEGMMSPDTPSGYPLSVTSAYRSFTYQDYLFSTYTTREMNSNPSLTKAQAEAIVETYSCRPGTSEHQTGLCCDMHTLSGADISFANYDQAKWLAENAWKFGFILRFPKDKTEVTGISFEPWHFRFVGRYHAYKIYTEGLCLEEYAETLPAELTKIP